MSLSGPCHRALTAKLEEKKTVGGVIFADGQVQTFGSYVDESVLRGWLQELESLWH